MAITDDFLKIKCIQKNNECNICPVCMCVCVCCVCVCVCVCGVCVWCVFGVLCMYLCVRKCMYESMERIALSGRVDMFLPLPPLPTVPFLLSLPSPSSSPSPYSSSYPSSSPSFPPLPTDPYSSPSSPPSPSSSPPSPSSSPPSPSSSSPSPSSSPYPPLPPPPTLPAGDWCHDRHWTRPAPVCQL